MKRVMITGGKGMLATDLALRLNGTNQFEIHALSREQLDVTHSQDVFEAISNLRPDIVIHTAAMHVDPCENDVSEAFRINSWATRGIARACSANQAVMVYISTCGLFGDRVKTYTEYDPVVLKTEYARSKYAGEEMVRQFCDAHFIIRPGWLFGGSIDHAKNFVVKRYEEAAKAKFVNSVYDKFGSPTYTGDLADGIVKLLSTDEYGVYHMTNQGGVSRADYVRRVIKCFGLNTEVIDVDSSHFPRKADVPDCEILEGLNLKYLGIDPLPSWQEAIERYITSIYAEVKAGK